MKKIDHYDGFTPSQRLAKDVAIDHETDGQTFRRALKTYRRELWSAMIGLALAGGIIWAFNTLIIN